MEEKSEDNTDVGVTITIKNKTIAAFVNAIKYNSSLFLIITIIFILFLLVFWGWSNHVSSFYKGTGDNYYNSYSPWGDSFAPFNVIISFLSVIGLIFTIYFQITTGRKQWNLSYKQNFSNEFYQIISNMEKESKQFNETIRKNISKEGKVFNKTIQDEWQAKFSETFERILRKIMRITEGNNSKSLVEDNCDYIFISYFNLILFLIEKIISDSVIDGNEKTFYITVMRMNLDLFDISFLSSYALEKKNIFLDKAIKEYNLIKDIDVFPSLNENLIVALKQKYGDNSI